MSALPPTPGVDAGGHKVRLVPERCGLWLQPHQHLVNIVGEHAVVVGRFVAHLQHGANVLYGYRAWKRCESRSFVRSIERPTSAAICVDLKNRYRASWRTITTSSSVSRKAGGSDARRNRGRRDATASVWVSIQILYPSRRDLSRIPAGLRRE
jgi:hypothetical protein